MTDLVTEHSGQLRLRRHQAQQASRDVNEPARQSERIRAGIVDHVEFPGQLRAFRRDRFASPDSLDIGLQRLAVDEPHSGADALRGLAAHLDFLRFADE